MEIVINYWAVLVSIVASVVIGFFWYGPLFGKQWMACAGIAMPDDSKPAPAVMVKPLIFAIIGGFLMAYVLSMFGASLMNAFWIWLGFIVPVHFSFSTWEGKPWKLFFIYTGYWLVNLLVMASILGNWM